jgi:hypothetical protein
VIGRGNRSTRRKPAPMPLFPPQTPYAARTRTRAAAVGSQRLTAWATARPDSDINKRDKIKGRQTKKFCSATEVKFHVTSSRFKSTTALITGKMPQNSVDRRWWPICGLYFISRRVPLCTTFNRNPSAGIAFWVRERIFACQYWTLSWSV